jgi:hypothetical protein
LSRFLFSPRSGRLVAFGELRVQPNGILHPGICILHPLSVSDLITEGNNPTAKPAGSLSGSLLLEYLFAWLLISWLFKQQLQIAWCVKRLWMSLSAILYFINNTILNRLID